MGADWFVAAVLCLLSLQLSGGDAHRQPFTTGSIKPGKLADLILVDGDPAVKLTDIDRVETVVKDGVVYKVADLDRALGVQPVGK